MATLTSSETPWLITLIFLCRLEIICRSYSVSTPTGPPRVMATTCFSRLPTSITSICLRKGYWVFTIIAAPPQMAAYTEDHFRLGCGFDSSFLQIPHWTTPTSNPSSGDYAWVSSGTLGLLPICSLLSGSKSDSHRLAVAHTGRTILRYL